MSNIEQLGEELLISTSREEQLNLDRKRLVINHTLTLHRDSASIKDLKAMIQHLENEGAPEDASISVDAEFAKGSYKGRIRVNVRWSTEPTK